jgi:hypothetical protein
MKMEENIQNISKSSPKIDDVGTKFFDWAENYWNLERVISKGLGGMNDESCPYSMYKEYFINKINELVDEKIKYEKSLL